MDTSSNDNLSTENFKHVHFFTCDEVNSVGHTGSAQNGHLNSIINPFHRNCKSLNWNLGNAITMQVTIFRIC